jgi:hypothetical protein
VHTLHFDVPRQSIFVTLLTSSGYSAIESCKIPANNQLAISELIYIDMLYSESQRIVMDAIVEAIPHDSRTFSGASTVNKLTLNPEPNSPRHPPLEQNRARARSLERIECLSSLEARNYHRKSRLSPFFRPSPLPAQRDSRRKSNTNPVFVQSIHLQILPLIAESTQSIRSIDLFIYLSISSSGIEYLRSSQSKNEPTAGGYAGA